jgi:hypothetical protein
MSDHTEPLQKKESKSRLSINISAPVEMQKFYKEEAAKRNVSVSRFLQLAAADYARKYDSICHNVDDKSNPKPEFTAAAVAEKKDPNVINITFKLPKDLLNNKVGLTNWLDERVKAVLNKLCP